MTLKKFLKECNRREVFKKLSLYIVISWVLMQVLSITWDPLGLPKKSVTVLILVLLIGLPIYAFFIGRFQVREIEASNLEDGVETEDEQRTLKSFKRYFYLGVLGLSGLVVIASFFIINSSFRPKEPETRLSLALDKIAVPDFENNTMDDSLNVVSEMASDWIIQGITENNFGQVISSETIALYQDAYPSDGEGSRDVILNEVIKPGIVISGNFYSQQGQLLFRCSIIDGAKDEIVMSFDPVSCDDSNPLECIESLKQRILGYFATKDDKELSLQQKPPTFQAYQYLIASKELKNKDEIDYLDYLNRAIEADPNYFEPKVLRVAHYYNLSEFEVADSLLQDIAPQVQTNMRQRNLLRFYESLLNNQYKQTYQYLMEEYKYTPFDLSTNTSAMVIAQQFVNRPEEVDSIFKAISMEALDIPNCSYCQARILMKASSELSLGNFQKVIDLPYNKSYYERPLLASYAATGKLEEASNYIDDVQLKRGEVAFYRLSLFMGEQLMVLGLSEEAQTFFNEIVSGDARESTKANAWYASGAYEKALPYFENRLNTAENPRSSDLVKAAVCHKMLGNTEKASELLTSLLNLRAPRQNGDIEYKLAQYYAITGDKIAMTRHLRDAVAGGAFFLTNKFQYDFHFSDYLEDESFQKIVTYWH